MTKLGEGGDQKVGQAPLTHRHVVVAPERKSHACGHMGDLLLEIFPHVGRSGRGDSKGGVTDQKQRRRKSHLKIFPTAKMV